MKDFIAPEIGAYAEAHSVPESEVCRQLREATYHSVDCPQMIIGALEGAFIKMMTQIVDAKRVLEIGTFTGYSALCFAEALPENGTVLTCDIDAETTEFAKSFWMQSPVGRKIESRIAPALETMSQLNEQFHVIFIDADKINYLNYYQRGLDLLDSKGIMLIDNVLWSGGVIVHPPPDESTGVIQDLNRIVAEDHRVSSVLVPIRDGVLVVRHNT